MKNKLLFGFLLGVLSWQVTLAQNYPGIGTSLFAGNYSLDINPSFIVSDRTTFEYNLISTSNSIRGTNFKINVDKFDEGDLSESITINGSKAIRAEVENNLKAFSLNFDTGEKMAFGLAINNRTHLRLKNLSPIAAKALINADNEQVTDLLSFSYKNVDIQLANWTEVGLAVARKVYSKEKHSLYAGIKPKLIFPVAHLGIKGGLFEYTEEAIGQDKIKTNNLTANYNQLVSDLLFDDEILASSFTKFGGFGMDVGLNYTFSTEKSGPDYFLKAGLAVIDLGYLKIKDGTAATFIEKETRVADDLDLDEFKSRYLQTNAEQYKIALPTSMNINLDWRMAKALYLNGAVAIPLTNGKKGGLTNSTSFSLTPRAETRWVGVYLPFELLPGNSPTLGFAARLGPIVVGTNNAFFWLNRNNTDPNLQLFVGVNFTGSKNRKRQAKKLEKAMEGEDKEGEESIEKGES